MPTAVDKLDKNSSDAQVKAAVSDCIATEMNNGKAQDQAIAMCHQMARDKTGKELAQ
ncbi:MAG: hypothetical protein ACWGQW_00305 [bacterium]